ncbi:MAG: tripartite tricarboxylate transporter substrate binding protein [Pigmentiphaga sp.]|nr:tripartite tricarboxylate transporter substrate binding protein [Pigmentiphaga sp.]
MFQFTFQPGLGGPMMRRRFMATLLGVGAAALAAAPFAAEVAYPGRAVRMIVPLPAGGASDSLARLIAQRLGDQWGQSVIVENRGGAGSIIGTQAVASAKPDGHTFGMVISAHTINPSLRNDLPYDTLKDFTPLTQAVSAPMAVVVHPDFPANDIAELVALAKSKPGAIEYASLGIGTATHLFGELLKLRAGIDLTHIPYSGSSPAYQDLLPGRVPVGIVVMESALPHVAGGRLKMLAISTAERAPSYPEFPTVSETIPGVVMDSSIGFVAPAGLAPEVKQTLANGLIEALRDPKVKEQVHALGYSLVGSDPITYEQVLEQQIRQNQEVVKAADLRIDK